MAIPKQQELYEKIFRLLADNKARSLLEIEVAMGEKFGLSDEEKRQMKGSGIQRLMSNRCGWATWRLSQPALVSRIGRGTYQITDAGALRAKNSDELTKAELFEFESTPAKTSGNDLIVLDLDAVETKNPEESIEDAFQVLQLKLVEDLLLEVKQRSPEFFENVVVQLMLAMGYGGSQQEAGKAVGRSGDGGIDGIINEDRLGLDAIYLQAKRWEGVVGRPEIMKFVGALAGQRATKGVFITTSGYTKEAKEYALTSQYKIVLIDGARLADLMIEHNLGVSVSATYQLKRIDSDFFVDE